MKNTFRRLWALALAVCLLFNLSACREDRDGDGDVTIPFSETNSRGNTNGNIANMGLGAAQGDWIVFTDMGAGGVLKASGDYGKECLTLMTDLQDIFACINLTGQRVDYISSIYGDINTAYLEDQTAASLIAAGSYCLQRVEDRYYYINESGDGGIYTVDSRGESSRVGTHAAYAEGITDEVSHASFSVCENYLYYCAADDSSRIYRVDLTTGEETRLSGRGARMLIADHGRIMFIDANNGRLCLLSEDGAVKNLTDHSVGTFNFDSEYIYYTDSSAEGSPLMRMNLSGEGQTKLCAERDTMYICILNGMLMLYCVDEEGNGSRTLFVSKNGGETYAPA